MTTSSMRTRRGGRAFGAVARILPIVLLVPTAMLFGLYWQSVGQDASFATSERHGVEYLQALVPVEIALTNAESTAVAGGVPPRDSLDRSMDTMSKVDDRLGDGLRSHDRWVELKTKINALPTSSGAPSDMFNTYSEVTDLVLALFDKVRNESKLIRDPDGDAYYLEDGAAQELPESIVAAAAYAGQTVIAARPDATQKVDLANQITADKADLASNASDLSDDVKLAVEGTGSKTLGTNLLTELDTYNRAIDALIPNDSATTARDTAEVNRGRDSVQLAATALSTSILTQVDLLIQARLSTLDSKRTVALVTMVVAVLLALVSLVTGLLGRRRPEGTPPAGAQQSPASRTNAKSRYPVGEPEPWPAAETTAGRGSAHAAANTNWERFGASR